MDHPVSPAYPPAGAVAGEALAQSPTGVSARHLFAWSVWFAAATALAELASLAVQKFHYAKLRAWSPEAMWMTPLAWLVFFGLVAAALLLASLFVGRARDRAVAIGAFTCIAAAGFLLTLPLSHWASALLALGIAVQVARVACRPDSLLWRAGWVIRAPLAAVTSLSVLGFGLQPLIRERIALARLPAATAGAPNVIFLILDTVRSMSVSADGYARATTPGLERIARRGTRFAQAIATGPYTTPSHIGMFSGRFPHEFSFDWATDRDAPLDEEQAVLSEVLASHGYRTVAMIANLGLATYEFGLDRGFARYDDFPIHAGQFLLSTSIGRTIVANARVRRLLDYHQPLNRKNAADITDDFLGWLDHRGDRPFFAFLNYFDAHEPYLPPDSFRGMFGDDGPPPLLRYFANAVQRWDHTGVPAGEIQRQLNAYDASIAYVDRHIERLVEQLERRGLLGRTILVITADHGEMFGEHGILAHVGGVYMTTLHVPFILLHPPTAPAGRVIDTPVSMADLPATIFELAGLTGRSPFPGRSLSRTWRDADAQAMDELILSEHTPDVGKKSLTWDRYHYIRFYGERERPEELYDWMADPAELQNLAGEPAGRPVLERLRTALDSIVAGNPWLATGHRSGQFPAAVADTTTP